MVVTMVAIVLLTCASSAVAAGRDGLSRHQQLRRLSMRQAAAQKAQQITLVQEDGVVDAVQSFFFALPAGVSIADCTIEQTSSNFDVLDVSDNQNMILSSGGSGQLNMTVSNAFDQFAGKTAYGVTVKHKGNMIYSSQIDYIIVGLTMFRQSGAGEKHVVSGDMSSYPISYQDAMASTLADVNQIRVFIQYPDGTNSDSTSSGLFPKSNTLTVTPLKFRGQYKHDPLTCDSRKAGKLTTATGLSLPVGCGYSFYRNEQGALCFGIIFEDNRSGDFSFDFSWPDLVSGVPALAEQGFETRLGCSVTGLPPIVVTNVEPANMLFREEGGQTLTVTFFNGDLRPTNSRQFRIGGQIVTFSEAPGSYTNLGGFGGYKQTVKFITEPGTGTNLPWTFEYLESTSATDISVTTAVVLPSVTFLFSYDDRPIQLTSLSPLKSSSDAGGELVTAKGYFAGFDPEVDGIYFNGHRVPASYIRSFTDTELKFTLPPRSEIGEGYEFDVDVRIGYATTKDEISFIYIVTVASVYISQSGTSEAAGNNVYRFGKCTPVRMTAVTTPYTNQVLTYQWSLTAITAEDSALELIGAMSNPSVSRSTQTMEILPEQLAIGMYKLHVQVELVGTKTEQTITLIREDTITVGTFILQQPPRSIAYPETPLRLSAVIRPPGECFSGQSGLMLEWTVLGRTQIFSSQNATGIVKGDGALVETPARLGWEYLIPQTDLVYGEHEVLLRTWMESDLSVSGSARTKIQILPAPLQAMIRSGESMMTINSNTSLTMFATGSYDPDEKFLSSNLTAAGVMSYAWSCDQTSGATDFSNEASITPCGMAFLPKGENAESFVIAREMIDALATKVRALKYGLIVRKDGRSSVAVSMIAKIDSAKGKQGFLSGYTLAILDAEKYLQDIGSVKYHNPVILSVTAPSDEISWTYALVDPPVKTLLTSANLIQSPAFYSPDVTSFIGNQKPLGIEASRLNPYTSYTIRVSFTGSAEYEDTDVYCTFRTSSEPKLTFPEPSIMSGTTMTQYIVTAGVSQDDSLFSYFFIMTDEFGHDFCIGGCTGRNVAYFRIGRAGKYSLSVVLFDTQGRAQLARKTLTSQLVVKASSEQHDVYAELDILFANGDDNSWTQLAYDAALVLQESLPSTATTALATTTVPGTFSATTAATMAPGGTSTSKITSAGFEDSSFRQTLLTTSDKVATLSKGLRRIFCASRSTSGHSLLGAEIATILTAVDNVLTATIYDLMATIECCLESPPAGTVAKVGIPEFLKNVATQVTNIDGSGSRRHLLQTTATDATIRNLAVDVDLWGAKMLTASSTVCRSEGFTEVLMDGTFSVAVAANNEQLPAFTVNNNRRRGIAANDDEEMVFYATGVCSDSMYAASGDKKRFLSVRSLANIFSGGNFQDPPPGGYLSDFLYRTSLYERNANGKLVEVNIEERQDVDPCFCYKLPVKYRKDELNNGLGVVASMYSVTNIKRFGVDVTRKGEAFSFETDGFGTAGFNINKGWVDVCSRSIGFAGSTVGKSSSQNALGGGWKLIGSQKAGIVGVVLAGLIFVVVAVVASWVIATKSMAAGAAQPVALEAHSLYVERDIYGRGTIFGSKIPA
jgi:REJ domain